MIDMVPKAISYTLVNFAKENLQQTLLEELYRQDLLDDLLRESPEVTARRKEWVQLSLFDTDAPGWSRWSRRSRRPRRLSPPCEGPTQAFHLACK